MMTLSTPLCTRTTAERLTTGFQVDLPGLAGSYSSRVLIQAPPELTSAFAFCGIAQCLTDQSLVVVFMVLPPQNDDEPPRVRVDTVTDMNAEVARLLAQDHVARTLQNEDLQDRLDELGGKRRRRRR